MTNAIKVLLQMTSVSLQPVPSLRSSLFNEFVCKLGPLMPKKAQFTHERVEYNVFFFVRRAP
jgi:hypothetical protein